MAWSAPTPNLDIPCWATDDNYWTPGEGSEDLGFDPDLPGSLPLGEHFFDDVKSMNSKKLINKSHEDKEKDEPSVSGPDTKVEVTVDYLDMSMNRLENVYLDKSLSVGSDSYMIKLNEFMDKLDDNVTDVAGPDLKIEEPAEISEAVSSDEEESQRGGKRGRKSTRARPVLSSGPGKPARRRRRCAASRRESNQRRLESNERERMRMHSINRSFDDLRDKMNVDPNLSKLETLKSAARCVYSLKKLICILRVKYYKSDLPLGLQEIMDSVVDDFNSRHNLNDPPVAPEGRINEI